MTYRSLTLPVFVAHIFLWRRGSVHCHSTLVHAAEGIVEEAKARNCDLIVMGSHGRRGIARFLLGSQALRVLTHSAVPVLVFRERVDHCAAASEEPPIVRAPGCSTR